MNRIRYKKDTTSPSEWQIWLAYVKYEGESGGKKRPVLITGIGDATCSILEITSQPPIYESDIPIADLYWTGLNKESVIQTKKFRRIPKDSLLTFCGTLSNLDRRRVKDIMGVR